jgi:hypothetical protein
MSAPTFEFGTVLVMGDYISTDLPAPRSKFWDDLAEDLKDPEFRTEYIRQMALIHAADETNTDLG